MTQTRKSTEKVYLLVFWMCRNFATKRAGPKYAACLTQYCVIGELLRLIYRVKILIELCSAYERSKNQSVKLDVILNVLCLTGSIDRCQLSDLPVDLLIFEYCFYREKGHPKYIHRRMQIRCTLFVYSSC